jgi:hypothetical protein
MAAARYAYDHLHGSSHKLDDLHGISCVVAAAAQSGGLDLLQLQSTLDTADSQQPLYILQIDSMQ